MSILVWWGMSVIPKSPRFSPLGLDSMANRNLIGAYQMQTVLRWASAFLIAFPLGILGLVVKGTLPWVIFPPALLACGMIIMIVLVNRNGDRRMWWFWPGSIMQPSKASESYEAQCWLREQSDQSFYCEVTAGCFKFKKKRHARLFYLHWCE